VLTAKSFPSHKDIAVDVTMDSSVHGIIKLWNSLSTLRLYSEPRKSIHERRNARVSQMCFQWLETLKCGNLCPLANKQFATKLLEFCGILCPLADVAVLKKERLNGSQLWREALLCFTFSTLTDLIWWEVESTTDLLPSMPRRNYEDQDVNLFDSFVLQ
jgi:hypothetical protein